ncbi:class I SAM-dependent methyltransferase [Aurantimonas sp. 22II-16-19i]|uniref:class I SAM-dependent methyltransferase n=1 Tax=Aurantimonas sp. 22II-16-19i TaxID=1317114 RepID=UPI0009F7E960|nr:class I SAM-dependent methyltransferase [Aurantimonas sp. 22II-16-19i]ORE91105.1 type 12 methyltransferase [Aurantimonas sp. 22II-16-19i]
MSGFAADWLALREPADRRARDAGLMRRASEWLAAAGQGATVVDLGCGTGSTLSAFEACRNRGGPTHRWRLLDNDPALLDAAAERARTLAAEAETRLVDLAIVDDIPLDEARLVTASALFDLASRDFITGLAERIVAGGAGLHAALSYDGSTSFLPDHPLDGIVVAGFNRHQLRPKGLGAGPSLGPGAARALAGELQGRGYLVELADSPWRLGPQDAALAIAHVEGMATAVAELGVLDPAELEAWRRMRVDGAERSETVVGHLDLLALPD